MRLDVVQARTHPSVLAWNLANEVADNGHAGGQAQFIDSAAQLVHRLDPGGRSPSTSGARTCRARAGFMYRNVDAIGGTNYEGWYDDLHASPATVDANDRRVARAPATRVPRQGARRDGVRRRGEHAQPAGGAGRPRLPGAALAPPHPHLPGAPVAERHARLDAPGLRAVAVVPRRLVRREAPDIALVRGLNQKGLFTYGGRAKPAAAVVRRLYAEAR